MSNDDNNSLKSNIFDYDIKLSPIHNEDDENSNSSFSLSQKYPPLFINNENFINYFMHIDYNTPLNNFTEDLKEISNQNIPKVESQSQNENKTLEESNKKQKKENKKEFGILFDIKTGISYNEEKDPVNYRKAKKRIQNRESALRMKKMREGINTKIEEELFHLREDNIRLINENVSLKKEKEFLIEQIKFMQKIIKESNLEFKLKNNNKKDDNTNNNLNYIDINKTKEPILYYDGSKQKIKGKLFNVFTICLLSIVYIIGECSFDYGNNKDNKGKEQGIKLNSVDEYKGKNLGWYYISKIILLIILGCIFQWIFLAFSKIKEFVRQRRKKKFI